MKLPLSSHERPFLEGSPPKDSQWGVARHRSRHLLDRLYVQRRHAAVARPVSVQGEMEGKMLGWRSKEDRLRELQSKADGGIE
jgi:hypothetical protein